MNKVRNRFEGKSKSSKPRLGVKGLKSNTKKPSLVHAMGLLGTILTDDKRSVAPKKTRKKATSSTRSGKR